MVPRHVCAVCCMVRGSLLVVVAAVVLSLLLHGLGINLVTHDVRPVQDGGQQTGAETTGSFADFAEVTPPPEPEETDAPEPPEVTEPEPVEAEVPATEVQVASDTPQDVLTPDTGTRQVAEPDITETEQDEPPAPQEAEAPEPEVVEPAGAEEAPATELAETPPVEVETTVEPLPETPPETPEVQTSEAAEPVEAEQPDLPELPEQPDTPEITVTEAVEDPEIQAEVADEAVLAAAVTRSLRPPRSRPTAPVQDDAVPVDLTQTATGAQQPVIQSSGIELLAQELDRRATGTSAFSGARATGNAATTNYAGQVLVHLNRSRLLPTTERGTAHVQFEIAPNGSLNWVRIVRRTGSAGIDRTAAAQTRSAAPFPRPPDGESHRLSFVYRAE